MSSTSPTRAEGGSESPPYDPAELKAAWERKLDIDHDHYLKQRARLKLKIARMPVFQDASEEDQRVFYRTTMGDFDYQYKNNTRNFVPEMHGKPLPRVPDGVYGGDGDAFTDMYAYQEVVSHAMRTSEAENKLATAFYFGCFGEPTPTSRGAWNRFLERYDFSNCKSLFEVYEEKYGGAEVGDAELAKDVNEFGRKVDTRSFLYNHMCDTVDFLAGYPASRTAWLLATSLKGIIDAIVDISSTDSTRSPVFSLVTSASEQHTSSAESSHALTAGVPYSSARRYDGSPETLYAMFYYASEKKTTMLEALRYYSFNPKKPLKKSQMVTNEFLNRLLGSYEASVYPNDKLYVAIVAEMNIPDSLLGEELLKLGARDIFNGTDRRDLPPAPTILSFLQGTTPSILPSTPGVPISRPKRDRGILHTIFEYALAVKTTLRASMLYFTFDPKNPSKESTMATDESLKRILESYQESVYPGDELYVAIVDEMNTPGSLLGKELLALGARGIFNGTGRTDDRSLLRFLTS